MAQIFPKNLADTPLYRLTAALSRWFMVSILWLVCSLPIVTLGAATKASLAVFTPEECAQTGTTQKFFRAFRDGFGRATVLWLLTLALMVLLGLDVLFLPAPIRRKRCGAHRNCAAAWQSAAEFLPVRLFLRGGNSGRFRHAAPKSRADHAWLPAGSRHFRGHGSFPLCDPGEYSLPSVPDRDSAWSFGLRSQPPDPRLPGSCNSFPLTRPAAGMILIPF